MAADPHLLELIGDVMGLLEVDEFHRGLMAALARSVPADWIALNDIGPDPGSIMVIIDPPASADLFDRFTRHAGENPLIRHYAATRDGRAIRFSDVVTQEELHALDLYQQFYRLVGVEHQIAFTLPTAPDRLLGVALSRRRGDFSDAERDLLNAARPFLIQAHRNAIAYSTLLAAREAGHPLSPAPDLD